MLKLAPKNCTLTEEEVNDLAQAKFLLEYPGLAARFANLLGKPIEVGIKALPSGWQKKVNEAAQAALLRALEFALVTLGKGKSREAKDWMHKLMVAGTGIVGGTFGLPALPFELPVSTCLMLRSIADIARSEGHDIRTLSVQLSCLEVFAMSGKTSAKKTESGYWAVRLALARAITEASSYLAERGLAEEGAPAIVRLIASIASRFGVIVSEEVAAKAVPVIGGASGAVINFAFMDHFQNMARGHFTVKRLEEKYGMECIRRTYMRIHFSPKD